MASRGRKPNRRTRFDEFPSHGLLRVASYNIHRCIGSDFHTDVGRVAAVIRELDCDTVGLQEVDSRPGPQSESMQLEFLANATGMHCVAGATIVHHERNFGNALLTRREILAIRRHDLSCPGYEPRGALDVEVDVEGTPVRIIVTHLGLGAAERRVQVRQLVGLLGEAPLHQPLVVLGDINEWLPGGRPLRWLHGLMGQAPARRTFPVWFPLFALDRVWVRPAGSLLAFGVHRSAAARKASDHFPVKAVVAPRGITVEIQQSRARRLRTSHSPAQRPVS